ncbi:uncharacterized protein LOC127265015 [Andrographis paniculata]|uniref:uncharacterized protein LOC127265015 n=1 Tax=Andrographis paniculata TaxID=175694 RepID=UPI0021E91036|nr:uncharacterized protein LOC127265015 [Andrographis paniculata]
MLMQDNHGFRRSENKRTPGACENWMLEIRSKCSIWSAIRFQAEPSYRSRWSLISMMASIEKLEELDRDNICTAPITKRDCTKCKRGLKSILQAIDEASPPNADGTDTSGRRAKSRKRLFNETSGSEYSSEK